MTTTTTATTPDQRPPYRLDALDDPEHGSAPLGPRVEHILVRRRPPTGTIEVSAAIASHLPGVPADFAKRLVAFGSVYWSPVPPPYNGEWGALREDVIRELGITQPNHPDHSCRRVTRDDDDCVGYGAYLRVHLQPRRFPRAREVDWAASVVRATEHFVVIDKPYGVGVPPTVDNAEENCLHMTRVALGLPEGGLRITHRLDQPTSGVLVFAKTKEFCAYFNGLLARREGVAKHYRVLTRREVPLGTMTHYASVGVREKGQRTRTVMHDRDAAEGEARRHLCQLRVLGCERVESGYESEVLLLTGRTHQIRAQFGAIGCGVVGDTVYGEGATRYEEGRIERFVEKIGLQAHKMVITDEDCSTYFAGGRAEFSARADPWWRTGG